jgi:hypothetical protein
MRGWGECDADGLVTEVMGANERSRDFHPGSHWLIPSPRYFAKSFPENPYCMIGNAWQAAVLFTGALWALGSW